MAGPGPCHRSAGTDYFLATDVYIRRTPKHWNDLVDHYIRLLFLFSYQLISSCRICLSFPVVIMHRILSSTIPLFLLTALSGTVLGGKRDENEIPFVACPLIGAYYPPPTISKSSDTFAQLQSEFTKEFDDLVKNGGSEKFGKITPNTTSFSVVLFGGAESLKDDPVFFEYHYTSPKDLEDTNTNLTSTTKFPVGDVSMVFTVYAWLVEMGENWETPITKYLPELADTKESLTVPWDDVTIGALAGQMSGLSRECKFPKASSRDIN